MRMRLIACGVVLLASSSASAAAARSFHVEHTYELKDAADLWVPVPTDDPWQRVTNLNIEPASFELVHDPRWGNLAAHLHGPVVAHVAYDVTRVERSADLGRATGRAAPSGYRAWLGPDALVPLDARVRRIAEEVTRGKATPLERARAIYAYVLANVRYEKTGDGWGRGDILWVCDSKHGNCTDFHALAIGLLRASGIPARFQIGYSIPEAASAELPGYHCWADFYLDGAGWIPLDASEAWKHPERRDYFFGHHDANRVTLSTGRDVRFPGMNGGPLNYFVYPYAEKGGQPVTVGRVSRMSALPSAT
jgi:transglutaminase-like putative cysteine protease